MKYAIATFCYGERYYNQTNRLIESFDYLEKKPNIYIVTDKPEKIIFRDFVFKKNINEYNSTYNNYHNNYYDFDFSVKRFSLLYAFDSGYNKVILVDTDVVVNESLYNDELILNNFTHNAIAGQVTYNFNNEIKNNSYLGERFLFYEKIFKKNFDKEKLNFMPEDCIQYIEIDDNLKFNFLKVWDDCIKIKNEYNLKNIPAGNIDEMSFSALVNGLKLINNSNKTTNILYAKHDKWY